MQAGGESLRRFNAVATSSTCLVSKHEPEVDFSAGSTLLPRQPPPSHPNMSRRWFFFAISTHLPLPPPSRPNASWRWFFQLLQRIYTDHHLPRVQTRAGGGLSRCFNASATITTPLASKRQPEVVFSGFFDASGPSITSRSNTSREFSVVSMRLPPTAANTTRRWRYEPNDSNTNPNDGESNPTPPNNRESNPTRVI